MTIKTFVNALIMRTIKKIKSELVMNNDVKGIVQVFEEMSARKMKDIREGILVGRAFLERLTVLSGDIGADLAQAEPRTLKKGLFPLSELYKRNRCGRLCNRQGGSNLHEEHSPAYVF